MLSLRYQAYTLMMLLTFMLSMQCQAQPEYFGFEQRTNLTNTVQVMERKDLTSLDKTEILATWLAREWREPSPKTTGLGGGDITSGYIQVQMITLLFTQGNPIMLAEASSDKRANPQMCDAMRISLGYMGDASQIPDLIRILRSNREGYYRSEAARALGHLGATEAIPALKKALDDEFSAHASNSLRGEYTAYPVRDSASAALTVLSKQNSVDQALERRRVFEERSENLRQGLAPLGTYLKTSRGWEIRWDDKAKQAIATHKGRNLHLVTGNGYAKVNDRIVEGIAPPALKEGRMLIPHPLGVKMVYESIPLSTLVRRPSR